MKVSGLTGKWNHKFILGFTDDETVMLDFDESTFKTVKYWANRTMKWFKLKGYIILKSSKNNYHVVFNRQVDWRENVSIVAWVILKSHKPKLVKWFLMQCIKEESTLRVSPKGQKPSPRVVYRYGKQDQQIHSFLQYRRLIKDILRRIRVAVNEASLFFPTDDN